MVIQRGKLGDIMNGKLQMPREELPIAIRPAILTLHVFTNSSFHDISRLLLVHPMTARGV